MVQSRGERSRPITDGVELATQLSMLEKVGKVEQFSRKH